MSASERRPGYWRAFLTLYGAGLAGILSLYPVTGRVAESLLERPDAPDMALRTLRLLVLVNPAMLLLMAVPVGLGLARKLGLRSHIAERARGSEGAGPPLRHELAAAVGWGVAAGLLTLGLDILSRPLLAEGAAALERAQPRTVLFTASAILYGGIAEELIIRWGLLTLLAWAGWRLVQRGEGRPRRWLMWTAIALSAVVFGAGHLPVLAAQVDLTPSLAARTVLLNAAAGVVFGWLFWRRSLESAMIAHALGHVVLALPTWAGWVPGPA